MEILKIEKIDIITILNTFNRLSESERLKGEFFKSRAFKNTSKVIEDGIVFSINENNRIFVTGPQGRISVLGPSSSNIFLEVYNTQKCNRLKDSPEISDLLNITGIGLAKLKVLESIGIRTVKDLLNLQLKIGELIGNSRIKYTEQMDTGIKLYLKTGNKRISHDLATEYLRDFKNNLILSEIKNFEMYVAGSYRRLRTTVGDLDVILVNEKDKVIVGDIHKAVLKWLDSIFVNGDKKISGIKGETQVDIRFIERRHLGAHLLHATGSQKFNIYMRGLAKSQGLRLNEYGIVKEGVELNFDNEREIFDYLNVPYVKPENRE